MTQMSATIGANAAAAAERMIALQARFGVRPPLSSSARLELSSNRSSSGPTGSTVSFDSLMDQVAASKPSQGSNVMDLIRMADGARPAVATAAPSITEVAGRPWSRASINSLQSDGTSATGSDVVSLARQYEGTPYVWGAEDPVNGFDCSGLVQYVYAKAGVALPRVSRDQATAGSPVASLADAVPGDLVAFGDPVDHIGIYAGNGQMVVAPHTGDVVKVQNITRTPTAIRRIISIPGADPQTSLSAQTISSPTAATDTGSDAAAPYRPLFQQAQARYGVSAILLEAVARAESGFRPDAVSGSGALGLMQLMPTTALALGVDPLDPVQAVDGSARLLAQHLRTYGSVELALAAYNAGPGAVDRYNGVPPFAETQKYVQKITADIARSAPAAAGVAEDQLPTDIADVASLMGMSTNLVGLSAVSTGAAPAATTTPLTLSVTTPVITPVTTPVTTPGVAGAAASKSSGVTVATSSIPVAFTEPTGPTIITQPGSWGPNTQMQVTSRGGEKTTSWGVSGLLAPAAKADIISVAPTATGVVAKGVLRLLSEATPAQLASPEFRKTINDINRDTLGDPAAPDVIPVNPPATASPAPAPIAAPIAAPLAAPPVAPPPAVAPVSIARPLPPMSTAKKFTT